MCMGRIRGMMCSWAVFRTSRRCTPRGPDHANVIIILMLHSLGLVPMGWPASRCAGARPRARAMIRVAQSCPLGISLLVVPETLLKTKLSPHRRHKISLCGTTTNRSSEHTAHVR
jgi:hypothetical protein